MPEVDLNTVQGLLAAIGNHGGLNDKLELYNPNTNVRYQIVAVYPYTAESITRLDIVRV